MVGRRARRAAIGTGHSLMLVAVLAGSVAEAAGLGRVICLRVQVDRAR